jgi:hypothetical protein
MDDTIVEILGKDRRPKCLLVSPSNVQKFTRKTRRNRGRNPTFYVINVTPAAEQPMKFYIGEELLQNNIRASGRYSTMTSRSYSNQWIRRL